MLDPAPRDQPRCPRCRGPLARERDRYGVYETCLLCGYVRDQLAGPAVAATPVDVGDRPR